MRSQTFSTHSIAAALQAADKAVGKTIPWQSTNDNQEKYLAEFHDQCLEDRPKIPEISQLAQFGQPDGLQLPLSVTGILDVLVKWAQEGYPEAITICRNRDWFEFPGVSIGNGGLTFYSSPGYPNTIACLNTQSDYQIYLTVANKALSGFELLDKIIAIHKKLTYPTEHYSGIRFPMTDLNHSPDISFFVGMKALVGSIPQMPMKDTAIVVTRSEQNNILRMDEVGARVRSKTNITTMIIGASVRDLPPPPLIIDEPFFAWLVKPGCNLPLFVAYVAEENWKKPASLSG